MAHSSTDTQIQQLRSQVSALEAENQRLRQSELRYRQVFENAPISMFLANREGYVTAMNAAAEELYGLKLEQLNEQACPIFDNPQLVENGTLPYMLRALAGEAIVEPPNSYDTSRGFESGQPAPGRGHYAPLRNTAGEVEGFVEICPDFNDFFALQAQLLEEKERAAQERARLLSTVAQVANFLLRAPNYTAVLPEVVRLLGKVTGSDRCAITQVVDVPAAHQYLTRLRHEWCRAEIPSVLDGSPEFDQGIIADTRSGFTSQLWQGEAVNFVVSELEQPEWIDFFTAHHNTSMLIVPVMIDRQCWGHIGFDNCGEPRLHDEAEIAILQVAAESIAAAIKRQAQDNALRESERRYRTLFELSNEGIFRFETEPPLPTALSIDEQLKWCYRHFRYAEINDTMADQYGLNGPEEMVGKGFADIYPETSALNLEANRRLIENGYQGRGAETEEIGADGQPKHFLSSVVSNIRDGYVYGGWGTQTDITELRQMQQALLEAEQAKSQKLEQLNAELRQTLAELEGRDRILNATATATNALLTVDSLDEAIDAALQLLGEALKTDRVVVIENSFPSDSAFAHWHILYQWNSPGTIAQIDHPDYAYGTYEGVESWYEWQRQGKVTSYLLDEMSDPFRSQQADLGVKALHVLPIFVAGEFWGTFGIDNCREAKRISAAELSVLRVAADCIGSAIQRDRSQQSLLTAKQAQIAEQARNEVLTQRDQLLNASATSVSALLTVENLDNAIDLALKTIGEVLDTDRASVVEFFYPDNSEASLPYWRLLYEWHTVSTPSQLGHPTAAEGTHDDFEDNYARLKQGDIFSDEIDDLPEPFRSQMAAVDVKAIHHVPIFIEDQLWGLLGFDDCCEVKRRSAAELSLLRVAADCIGSAIARQRSQSLLQQTEHARAVEQTRNVVLQQRDHILNATATATNALLTVDSLDEAIGAALQTIGEALETDRANVLENLMPAPDSAFPGWRHSGHEWASPGTVLQHSSSEAAQGSYEDIPWLYELFQRGQTASYQIEDTPEPFRSAQVAIGVKSTHLVPIFVEGQWWGVLGFDDCQTAKQRSAAELSILKVAADCIGSAIQRERSQQSLQQAEQARVAEEVRNELLTQRDRLLNASATSVSALLTVENLDEAINLALQTIGEAVETDRAIVVEFFYSDTDAPLPLWRLLYEWNTPITLSQLADPINSQGTHEGLEALLVSLAQGESLSITLDEMAEPFRSQQAALGVKVMHDV
ncbi:MAG: GAF domain-containing protein [Cyanobacteria bacterium J06628_6]